ncbi:hypothetical protein M8C21_009233 [Ambrosia artemisiifolia]|uniref:Uncharacterized protein n=1 Tax=Ambrosia artemisiifolia TaxID=4212 RepID=A0AAD5GQY2_AMBAR|nr:hypothetical protein M8C21_009233 [Ambrosia artemisiifolia]
MFLMQFVYWLKRLRLSNFTLVLMGSKCWLLTIALIIPLDLLLVSSI